MKPESELADFVTRLQAAEVPASALRTARRVLMAGAGAGIAGAGEEGIAQLRQLLQTRGGAGEARALVFGGKLPAHAAAQFNGTLCRALDYCDAPAPGAHIGSSVIPAGLAAAELAGGCSGTELLAARVTQVSVRLNPYCHRLVGNEFRLGDNPRVNAQFSAQYCVANALLRKASKLRHFRPGEVAEPAVRDFITRVNCAGDPALDARGHSAVAITITTDDGEVHERNLDISPGFPGNALSDEDHAARFKDCMDYAAHPLPDSQISAFLETVEGLDALPNARTLVDCLIAPVVSEK